MQLLPTVNDSVGRIHRSGALTPSPRAVGATSTLAVSHIPESINDWSNRAPPSTSTEVMPLSCSALRYDAVEPSSSRPNMVNLLSGECMTPLRSVVTRSGLCPGHSRAVRLGRSYSMVPLPTIMASLSVRSR